MSSRPAFLAAAYLARISCKERAWYFCGSWLHSAPAKLVVKVLSPLAIASALAADHGRNSRPISSVSKGIRPAASDDQPSNGPSALGDTIRCTHAITFGADARMIPPGVGSVAAS